MDKDVVLAASGRNGRALEYASARLKDDPVVVMEALENSFSSDTMKYASKRLKADKAIMLRACQIDGSSMRILMIVAIIVERGVRRKPCSTFCRIRRDSQRIDTRTIKDRHGNGVYIMRNHLVQL